jgi:hypothetical protein
MQCDSEGRRYGRAMFTVTQHPDKIKQENGRLSCFKKDYSLSPVLLFAL